MEKLVDVDNKVATLYSQLSYTYVFCGVFVLYKYIYIYMYRERKRWVEMERKKDIGGRSRTLDKIMNDI